MEVKSHYLPAPYCFFGASLSHHNHLLVTPFTSTQQQIPHWHHFPSFAWPRRSHSFRKLAISSSLVAWWAAIWRQVMMLSAATLCHISTTLTRRSGWRGGLGHRWVRASLRINIDVEMICSHIVFDVCSTQTRELTFGGVEHHWDVGGNSQSQLWCRS